MTDHFDRGIPPHLELGERGEFALRWLAQYAPAPIDSLWHNSRSDGGYAHGLGAAMQEAGLIDDRRTGKRHGYSQGAANTLVALKRRGLARNSTTGGEAFQAVRWGNTEKGIAHLRAIDAFLSERERDLQETHREEE